MLQKKTMQRPSLRDQSGFSLLTFAVILSALLVTIMYFTIGKSSETAKRMGQNMSMSFANDISTKLAQKIRYAYDVAEIDQTGMPAIPPRPAQAPQPGFCAGLGGLIVPISASLKLCMVNREICVDHPRGTGTVCVKPSDGTLLAKATPRLGSWWLNEAVAQVADRPANPNPADTSNSLTVNPTCLDGNCRITCTANAACVTYKFCPLASACNADQFVWQTIALLK